jgi:DNA polymerase-3 subunit epsilon
MSSTAPRQIIFDTETTGLEHKQGDRIIEFAGIEAYNGVPTGKYLVMQFNPDREVDPEASKVNGLTWEMLKDKPRFRDSVQELVGFIEGAELIAYNAGFDEGFLQAELERVSYPKTIWEISSKITDALKLARSVLRGVKGADGKALKNMKLDTLIEHFGIDGSERNERHSALVDSKLLAQVYQRLVENLDLSGPSLEDDVPRSAIVWVDRSRLGALPVVSVSAQELSAHNEFLADIQAKEKVEPVGLKKPSGPRP